MLCAGGSGMAPVRSILKTMHHFRINRKAIYFFGALSHQDLFYLDEMEKLQKGWMIFGSYQPYQTNLKGVPGRVKEDLFLK